MVDLADSPLAFRAMTIMDLDRVMAVETMAYSFPWTRGNFIDSIAAGYLAELMTARGGDEPIGYFVAMAGVDELHLLNLTVAPAHQRQGHAGRLLDVIEARARDRSLATLWLEVRESNDRALRLYGRRGFTRAGLRRGYYPAAAGRREDAVVMALAVIPAPVQTAGHVVE